MSINNPFSLNSTILPFFNNIEFKTKFLENNELLNQIIDMINENTNNINKSINYSKIVENSKLTENNRFLQKYKNSILKNNKSLYLFYYLYTLSYVPFEYKHRFRTNLNKNKLTKYTSLKRNILEIIKNKYSLILVKNKEDELSTLLEHITPLLPKTANQNVTKLFQNEGVKVYKSRNAKYIYKDKNPGEDDDSYISLYKECLIQYILHKYSDEAHKKYIPHIYNIYRRKSGSFFSPITNKKYVRIKMENVKGVTFDQFLSFIFRNTNYDISDEKLSLFLKLFMLKVLNIMNYFYTTFGLIHHGLKANNIMVIGNYRNILRYHINDLNDSLFDIKIIDFGKSVCNFNYIQNNENHNLKLCGQEMDAISLDRFIVIPDISNEFSDVFYFIHTIVYGLGNIDNCYIIDHLRPLFYFQIIINKQAYTLRNENFCNYSILCVTYNTLKGYLISLLLNKYNNISIEDIENSNFTTVYHQFITQFYYRNIISNIERYNSPERRRYY